MTFESIDDIAKARRACPRPGLIVKALLGNKLEAKSEVLTIALVSALAAMCLFNDKDGSNDVLSAFAGSKQTTIIKAVETAFTQAVAYTACIVNVTGDATRVENAGYFVSMFGYAAGVLHENIKQALSPKPKAPRAKDAPAQVETTTTAEVNAPTTTADEVKAAVAIHNFEEAQHEIEILKRQIEGQKLANYALKTRVTRLRSVANAYRAKAQTVADKPTRATKSRVKV